MKTPLKPLGLGGVLLSFFVMICNEETLKFEVKMRLNRPFEVKFEIKRTRLSERDGRVLLLCRNHGIRDYLTKNYVISLFHASTYNKW